MVIRFFRGQDGERLDAVEAKIETMFRHDRHEFELAMSGLMGVKPAGDLNDALRSTDRKVNQLEREIRRELIVHASVVGRLDTPAVLIYMSIVKDIERVGDYAKNILDLALDGADFSKLPDPQEWHRAGEELAEYITDAGKAFLTRDGARSRALLARGDALLDAYDDGVSRLVRGEDVEQQAVARALGLRYLKRVVAHLMNVLSAVVMPLDKLDYFDEDPEDRR
jgi:phosphate uptake regulator